jgi:septal ring factor EnvC (AmiA/AmiB activator)
MAMVLLLMPAVISRGDEPVKPEQLKKAYDDALVQLKAAQDRKAELAKENDALSAKVEELKKQLAESQAQVESLKHDVSDSEEKTFYLRSYHAAWQSFMRRYPEVMARWKLYLGDSMMCVPREMPDMVKQDSPGPVEG